MKRTASFILLCLYFSLSALSQDLTSNRYGKGDYFGSDLSYMNYDTSNDKLGIRFQVEVAF